MPTAFRWTVNLPMAFLASLGLFLNSHPTAAGNEDKDTDSKVVSVALFKNGLAVIKRQVALQGGGVVRVADVPEPVHGTFFVESNGPLEVRVEKRRVALKTQPLLGQNLQDELAGLKVSIYCKNSKANVSGTVISIPKPVDDSEVASTSSLTPSAPNPSRFLLLKTENGVSYVDVNEIASVEAEGDPKREPITENKPVLLLDAGAKSAGSMAQISYLTHGISWAPSYKVVLTDATRMSIEQNAVIRNELMDLSETEVSVISGYPSVQFGEVVSPLAATQTWTRFFQQLGLKGGNEGLSNSVMIQSIANNRSGGEFGTGPTVGPNDSDTIDLHYHSIGKRSLKKGDAIAISTGTAQVEYERIVQWTISDTRDEWGRPQENRQVVSYSGEYLQDDVWDALKFKNTLAFPMTSAPAMVTTGNKFIGQGQVLWTNKNEEATLRINKALSIRARHFESESQVDEPAKSERDFVNIGGLRFRKATINGELKLSNNRATESKIIIKRQFSGDYVKGDDSPKIDLREEGAWTVNKRNELQWTIVLKPGEERTVKYQYTVLVYWDKS